MTVMAGQFLFAVISTARCHRNFQFQSLAVTDLLCLQFIPGFDVGYADMVTVSDRI
jgi:hypothetical protein